MKSSETYQPTLSFALLLVGPPKSGKTTLALQFPSVYIADCDNNLSGPAAYHKSHGLERISFHYDTINVDGEGKEVPLHLRWTQLTACLKQAVNDPNIKTIVIDGLSSISDYLVEHILRTEGQKHMRIQDWSPFQYMIKRLITWLRTTGKLVIFTAHETVEKDELDGVLKYFIHVPTKLRDNLGGFFSDVWRVESEKQGDKYIYQIRTRPTVRFSLGTSFADLPIVMPAKFSEIVKHAPALQGT